MFEFGDLKPNVCSSLFQHNVQPSTFTIRKGSATKYRSLVLCVCLLACLRFIPKYQQGTTIDFDITLRFEC